MELLDDLESQIKTTQQKQSESAGSSNSCCIYTVPRPPSETRDEAYHPQVVAIGPKHISDTVVKDLKVMQKHKVEFLADLLDRKKLDFNELMKRIRPVLDQKKARECYSKEIKLESFNDDDDRFLKMMVLDGCFLIELFLKAADQSADHTKSSKDPLANIPRAVPRVYRDLLMVENQIPFFVLEELFATINNSDQDSNASETSKLREESDASLFFLALQFFYKVMQWPDGVIEKFRKKKRATREDQKPSKPLHLLDLVRSTCIPTHDTPKNNEACCLVHRISKLCKRKMATPTACRSLIHSISKLRRAGIKLKLIKQADSFLDVKFRKGVIQMPNIIMDYNMKTFLLNCVACEQLHNSLSKHFTVYATFLDCLVDTAMDVGHLCESNIVDSYFGNYDDVVQFINKMGKDLVFDDDQFYLSDLFKDVNDRYQGKCRVQWASFKKRYFNSPWSFISALAGLVLLVLTFLQTFYTIYAYYVKSKP